jgi:hypothetical protein
MAKLMGRDGFLKISTMRVRWQVDELLSNGRIGSGWLGPALARRVAIG